jgi:hypothetical protein
VAVSVLLSALKFDPLLETVAHEKRSGMETHSVKLYVYGPTDSKGMQLERMIVLICSLQLAHYFTQC